MMLSIALRSSLVSVSALAAILVTTAADASLYCRYECLPETAGRVRPFRSIDVATATTAEKDENGCNRSFEANKRESLLPRDNVNMNDGDDEAAETWEPGDVLPRVGPLDALERASRHLPPVPREEPEAEDRLAALGT